MNLVDLHLLKKHILLSVAAKIYLAKIYKFSKNYDVKPFVEKECS